ncbi:hypothetical protein GCM10018785_25300 [Streptomyces longispororuber]|uniref:Uncharacterized protein n=1 Tax=Streptomyces longispororuber TaxID=68230 RepID=A0A918ZIL2_9ACTN|nr:hypothetical protein GCM10018785_25300 [Streptomyces longispororuber]
MRASVTVRRATDIRTDTQARPSTQRSTSDRGDAEATTAPHGTVARLYAIQAGRQAAQARPGPHPDRAHAPQEVP